jgi:hypothetical protein
MMEDRGEMRMAASLLSRPFCSKDPGFVECETARDAAELKKNGKRAFQNGIQLKLPCSLSHRPEPSWIRVALIGKKITGSYDTVTQLPYVQLNVGCTMQ